MVVGAAEKSAELDFNAVQRGDAQMEQKLNRLIRACIELGAARNPILSIHDQGTLHCTGHVLLVTHCIVHHIMINDHHD